MVHIVTRNNFPTTFFLFLAFLFIVLEQAYSTMSGAASERSNLYEFYTLITYHSLFLSFAIPKLFIHVVDKNIFNFRLPLALYLSILALTISLSLSNKITPMPVISLFYLVIIHVLALNSIKSNRVDIIGPVGLIYCLATISIPLIFEVDVSLIYSLSSFNGFSSGRTYLAFLCGIITLIWINSDNRKSIFFLPFSLYILFLSESRAGIVALFVCCCYLVFRFLVISKMGNLYIFLAPFLLLFIVFAGYFFSGFELGSREVTLFQDSGLRLEKSFVAQQEILMKPFFGNGALYSQVYTSDGFVEPHNILLQSLLDFGIIPTLSYFLYLAKLLSLIDAKGRSFIIYWFVFGLFHPGFSAFFADLKFILILLLSVSYPRSR